MVYLTEELVEDAEAKLIPIVVYPEATATWEDGTMPRLLGEATVADLPQLPSARLPGSNETSQLERMEPLKATPSPDTKTPFAQPLARQRQIVLPLIHEDVMMGLLVTTREDRPWNGAEQGQIERIAQTLAIARVLDQRGQWLEQELHQQQLFRSQQHEIFDDLLHQFRNPLTALRTFGKLLLRRLLPGDANRDAAAGIVRESDRLQELLQQFDQAVDLGEANLTPLALNPAAQQTTGSLIEWEVDPRNSAQVDGESQSPKPIPLLPGAGFLSGADLVLETCSIAEVLEPLLISARAIAQERYLDLQASIPQSLPPVHADVRALREVLSNLIDNALKYTPTGGQIYIHIVTGCPSAQGMRQAVMIRDTGPGIPPQDLAHVFERHYRGVQTETDIPGSGLGLAIARDLVTQMHGEIQVFSPANRSDPKELSERAALDKTNPEGGTAFVVLLPEVDREFGDNSAIATV